jgi:hypothetical protein
MPRLRLPERWNEEDDDGRMRSEMRVRPFRLRGIACRGRGSTRVWR